MTSGDYIPTLTSGRARRLMRHHVRPLYAGAVIVSKRMRLPVRRVKARASFVASTDDINTCTFRGVGEGVEGCWTEGGNTMIIHLHEASTTGE